MGDICHEGIVRSVNGNMLTVEIVSKSMCVSCHAKGACSASDMKIKEIDVVAEGNETYAAGEKVNLVISHGNGLKAVLFSYIFPLAILMFLLLYLQSAKVSEPVSALVGAGSVAAYYFLLFLFRKKIDSKIHFRVEKLTH